ncbi:GntR family transcriptional regulator [Acidisoma cellulosilytica]|uniref:GntR family transcriptional regulator n=1 Tax=Acidisoma cellulosilyticum TaxID=2802395 RepID=A0A963Z763_9PROT|nr:GntR family transcriptional regulator [Acidisoma cellulosilyticum]MCB8883088.1 GntR family transcriptional regulator [Acidisoma cellulosilyticum]
MTQDSKALFRHETIARQLIQDIRSGVYPVGTQLPPELLLGQMFKASRHTVRQALKTLTDRGLIVRRASSGSMIISAHEPRIMVQSSAPMTKALANPSDLVRTIVGAKFVTVTKTLAKMLQCDAGERKLRIHTIVRSTESDLIVSAVEIYVAEAYAGILDHPSHKTMRISDQIVDMYDEEIERVQVEVFAGKLPAPMPKLLNLDETASGLGIIRRYVGRNDAIFEVSVTYYGGDQHVFLMELRRQTGGLSP